ncbi:hypothetical protein D9M71_197360 [compost metagenome]
MKPPPPKSSANPISPITRCCRVVQTAFLCRAWRVDIQAIPIMLHLPCCDPRRPASSCFAQTKQAQGPGCDGEVVVRCSGLHDNMTEATHGGSRQRIHGQQRAPTRHHQGGAQGHLRLVPGHRVRMVRLLPVRLPRGDHRQALLRRCQRNHLVHLRPPRLRRRLCRTALRRHRVRSPGRHDRAQVHLSHHHCHHGLVHRSGGAATGLRHDWRGRADHPDHPALAAGAGAGR